MGKSILKNIVDEIASEYSNIRIWMEAMRFTSMNNMVLHSFVREFVFKNFDIFEFCKRFDRFIKKKGDWIKHQPLNFFQEFIVKSLAEERELLNGEPIKKAQLPEKVCLYLSAYKFYRSIISEGDEAFGWREISDLKKKRVFRLMIEDKLTPDDMSHWKGELTGVNNIIWFTKYDSIPQKFRNCSDNPEAAQRIRDLLGMSHLFDDGLIEVQIPKEIVEKGSRVPTICEALGYPYFRPAKRKDGFGREIDLNKKSTGLPVAVHTKIRWEENFKVRYIGMLPKEKEEFSDQEWRQVTSKSQADLIAFIKGLEDEA